MALCRSATNERKRHTLHLYQEMSNESAGLLRQGSNDVQQQEAYQVHYSVYCVQCILVLHTL